MINPWTGSRRAPGARGTAGLRQESGKWPGAGLRAGLRAGYRMLAARAG